MLEAVIWLGCLISAFTFGYTLGHNCSNASTLERSNAEVARRVWPRLQDWRDRELSEALAKPDQAREQLITRIWRRRVGLRPHEETPVEVQRQIRDILECPWPERED